MHVRKGLRRLKVHETSEDHKISLENMVPDVSQPVQQLQLPDFVSDGIQSLLASLAAPAGSTNQAIPSDYTEPELPPPTMLIDWGLSENTELEPSAEARAVAQIAQTLVEYFNADPNSEDEEEERSDNENELEEPEEPTVTVDNGRDEEEDLNRGEKRARFRNHTEYSRQWFPWADRITCTLDVLMHLPRSVFSQRQLDLFIWLLKVNNVDDVPSVKSMQELNARLQKLCGIQSMSYDGALGHKYYVNSLAQIIAQEMSNPKVRPHLEFYPEDSGSLLEEARQGKRWLEEIPSDQITPMARIGTQDYFIHEPAMLTDGTFRMPFRWFLRGKTLFAKCWDLDVVNTETGRAWRVVQRESEVAQEGFMKNLPELRADFRRYNVPDPTKIKDVQNPSDGTTSDWTFTDPAIGNPWRERAKGARVYCFPIWLYCDDTSGNLSKKWNEHNSFLFTPAGLPREQSQKEFNIHFLSTSNIAPPLEMLDGILDQLETAQKDGIWAWDSELKELVLVIPAVLALLGDNPMQSEFACHIGLRGKYFCRACWVKGSDNLDEEDGEDPPPVPQNAGAGSDAESQASSDAGSDTSQQPTGKVKSRRKKIKESLDQMVERAKSFVKIGRLRTRTETTGTLRTYFKEASTLNTKTRVKTMRTATGIKDTFQIVFLEKLFDSYKGKKGKKAKQEALEAQTRSLPKNTTSPVWRIKGLDPHQDTPVEILHVILLGFNQIKNAEQKALLVTRLNSFDVTGLGISPLAGHTLVQYSGSLTGRDFRAIAQVAPFVAYDLVSEDCLATWVALSKLVPLIWQPSIKDIDALLTAEINHFLTCAARWTTRWFNKPKFHILLHLPEHIRRFGPAILFATEAFESFNAIIRAKSVHSNRHAPSRDIARAFAQGNRIRHLLSGGLFMHPRSGSLSLEKKEDWVCAGPGPLSLVSAPNTVTQYLGLENKKRTTHGAFIFLASASPIRKTPRPFATTLTGQKLPASLQNKLQPIKTNSALYLANGDFCPLNQFIIARRPNHSTFIARVMEIIQIPNTPDEFSQRPSGILLQNTTINRDAHPSYGMPAVNIQDQWSLVSLMDILCTVNVQHNCHAHTCGPTGVRYTYQERERTEHIRPVIVHNGAQDDLLLNTGQMRDALHLQPFRVNSPVLDTDTLIMASVLREFDQKKAAASSSDSVPFGRGRGGAGRARGRGRGSSGAAPGSSGLNPGRLVAESITESLPVSSSSQ
ncbi:hypothetical protein B0H17DRAFT_1164135 [Mycena rosella]|uniref:Uncharacterized protein n=1 Tax=Mycena rosella TaxID=1033263 RepID=A0AAD7FQT1_MYCRO|nr:hypothetical protein B0H17DRAFT_1164135 [Mycena rosella]